jgi:hypothetical protein
VRRFLYRVACRVERVPGLVGRACGWLIYVPSLLFVQFVFSPLIGWYFFRYPTFSLRDAADYALMSCGLGVCPERLCELERKMNSIREDD